ncbi:tyrosine-type recombinase/integrase [Luteimonas sp. e5]
MAKFAFTDSALAKLEPTPGRPRIDYDDGDVRGFAIQTTPAGRKTFLLVYQAKATGRERRMVIGQYGKAPALSLSAAKRKAIALRAAVNDGGDPWQEAKDARAAAEERQSTGSLGALLEAYTDALERDKKPSAAATRKALETNVQAPCPTLWKKPAGEVTVDDLLQPLAKLIRAKKYRQAEKVRSYIRAAYTMAAKAKGKANNADLFKKFAGLPNIARDLETIDRPKIDTEAMEEQGKRALSLEELRAYWKRITAMDDPDGALLRFHLLTGAQRAAQLARATTANVDGDTLTLFDSKGRRKQARRHVVPLIPDAMQAMEAMQGSEGKHVFTIDAGQTGAEYHVLRHRVAQVAADMFTAGEVAEPFTAGELRITVETRLQAAGVNESTRAHLQSHGLGGVQNRHYAKHDFSDEKREALELLRMLCEPPADNVTPIKREVAA